MNPLNIRIIPRTLHFRQPAGTSRGVYTTRNVWYILIRDNATGRIGLGECAPLPDLSCDALPDYTERLIQFCQEVEHSGKLCRNDFLLYPSMLFGLETALRHLQTGTIRLWDSAFSRGEEGIPINGLVWMGTFEEMKQRIHEKSHKDSVASNSRSEPSTSIANWNYWLASVIISQQNRSNCV